MVVVSLMMLLLVLAVPSIRVVTMGTVITRSGHLVTDQFALARQEAMGKGMDVQVRIFEGEPGKGYTGLQLWGRSRHDLAAFDPISAPVRLVEGTVIAPSTTLSPLIDVATLRGTARFAGANSVPYFAFQLRYGGGTDLPFGTKKNYVTIVRNVDYAATTLPANYAIVRIDAESGHATLYRP